jgi:hypothetical protein
MSVDHFDRKFGSAGCSFCAGFTLSPSSTRRRIASGRDRSAACFLIHASSTATSAGGTRTPIRMAPTFGLPIGFFFLLSDIDLLISICYQKGKPEGSVTFRPGSNPSHKDALHDPG